jgi:hypothetical protein
MVRRLIVGSVAFLVVVGMAALGVTYARTAALRLHHRSNLEQLVKSMTTYLDEDGGGRFYPASLGALHITGAVKDEGVFVSPVDDEPWRLPTGLPCSFRSAFDTHRDYQYLDGFEPQAPMVWDRKPFFGGKYFVGFFNYSVERVEADAFGGLLRQLGKSTRDQAQRRPDADRRD